MIRNVFDIKMLLFIRIPFRKVNDDLSRARVLHWQWLGQSIWLENFVSFSEVTRRQRSFTSRSLTTIIDPWSLTNSWFISGSSADLSLLMGSVFILLMIYIIEKTEDSMCYSLLLINGFLLLLCTVKTACVWPWIIFHNIFDRFKWINISCWMRSNFHRPRVYQAALFAVILIKTHRRRGCFWWRYYSCSSLERTLEYSRRESSIQRRSRNRVVRGIINGLFGLIQVIRISHRESSKWRIFCCNSIHYSCVQLQLLSK